MIVKLIGKLHIYKINYLGYHSADSTFKQKLIEENTLTEDHFRDMK